MRSRSSEYIKRWCCVSRALVSLFSVSVQSITVYNDCFNPRRPMRVRIPLSSSSSSPLRADGRSSRRVDVCHARSAKRVARRKALRTRLEVWINQERKVIHV